MKLNSKETRTIPEEIRKSILFGFIVGLLLGALLVLGIVKLYTENINPVVDYCILDENCICDNCLRIQFFEEDKGHAFFRDGILIIPEIEDLTDYPVPTESDIVVCEEVNQVSGDCKNFLYRIALNGKC